MKEVKLSFPLNYGGEIEGVSDAGMETFKNSPLISLAREICQNSLDARKDWSKSVLVEFKTFSIGKDDIPDVLSLEKCLDALKIYWKADTKALKIFSHMKETLQAFEIVCLRISDFNTTGLQCSAKGGLSAWQSLVKTKGYSTKRASEGGSFGIGKFAPFATSALRCVFYATKDNEGLEAFQGVARLASFKNEKGELTRDVGYFGNPIDNEPIYSWYSLDKHFSRFESGTDIFILGFEQNNEWKKEIIASVLDSFLYAIYEQNLIVKVENEQINKDNLPRLIKQYKTKYAQDYYSVLIDNQNTKIFEQEYNKYGIKGSFCLRLLALENSKKHTAMIRQSGMKIKDKAIGNADFSGVFLINGDGLNEYLKSLEDPSHLNWSKERADDPKIANEVLNSMYDFINQSYYKLISDSSNEQIDAPAGEFVPLYHSKQKCRQESIFDYINKLDEQEYIKNTPQRSALEVSDDKDNISIKDQTSNILDQNSIKNPNQSQKQTKNESQNKSKNEKTLENEGAKNEPNLATIKKHLICKNQTKGEYRVIFEPHICANDAKIAIFLSTEDGDRYKVNLKNAFDKNHNECKVLDNEIINLEFYKNIPVCFDFCIDYDEICALEVRVYENR